MVGLGCGIKANCQQVGPGGLGGHSLRAGHPKDMSKKKYTTNKGSQYHKPHK